MEAEATAKAEREAAAKLAAEEARIRADERAKSEAEAKARMAEAIIKSVDESKPKTVAETAKLIMVAEQKPLPSDAVLLTSIASDFNITYAQALTITVLR